MTKAGPSDATPVVASAPPAGRRILAVDAARAAAIVGMLAINVGPRDDGGLWGRLYTLPHGRASLLFVLVAGVGVSLLTRRARRPGAGLGTYWASLLWRSVVLLVGGLALAHLDHEVNVILPTYALLFVLAGTVLRAPGRLLLGAALVMTVVGPALWLLSQQVQTKYTFEAAVLGDPPGEVLHSIVLSGPYPLVTWVAPFLFGMWLGRQDLASRRLQNRLLLGGAAVAVAAVVVSAAAELAMGTEVEAPDPRLLLTGVVHGQMPLWLLGGTASAVFVLGVLLRLPELVLHRLWPVVAAGQLALTIYVGHLFVLDWVRPAPHDLAQGALLTLTMTVAALVLATVWRAFFARGPLEVLIRPPWTWAGR